MPRIYFIGFEPIENHQRGAAKALFTIIGVQSRARNGSIHHQAREFSLHSPKTTVRFGNLTTSKGINMEGFVITSPSRRQALVLYFTDDRWWAKVAHIPNLDQ